MLCMLTSDVANPVYDKRHKYGEKGWKTLSIGTVFHYKPAVFDDGERWCRNPAYAHTHDVRASGIAAETLLANSVEVSPKTFSELSLSKGWNTDAWASDILEELLREKIVSIETLDKVFVVLLDERK